jgi:nucleoside-diphosphate-sugar epimerase
VLGLKPGQLATEEDGLVATDSSLSLSGPNIRQGTAHVTQGLAKQGVRSSVLRLSPTVHGEGDNGFMATLISIARQKGLSGYVGEGSSRWPAVHRLDAALLFRLALEKAPAGSTLHAVAEEGIPTRDIAEAIGAQLHLPVVAISANKAGEHFGFLSNFLAMDSPVSSQLTRSLLDWQPTQPGLIEDLNAGHYFKT